MHKGLLDCTPPQPDPWQLRELQLQKDYVNKLRQQRSKIEEIKLEYDQTCLALQDKNQQVQMLKSQLQNAKSYEQYRFKYEEEHIRNSKLGQTLKDLSRELELSCMKIGELEQQLAYFGKEKLIALLEDNRRLNFDNQRVLVDLQSFSLKIQDLEKEKKGLERNNAEERRHHADATLLLKDEINAFKRKEEDLRVQMQKMQVENSSLRKTINKLQETVASMSLEIDRINSQLGLFQNQNMQLTREIEQLECVSHRQLCKLSRDLEKSDDLSKTLRANIKQLEESCKRTQTVFQVQFRDQQKHREELMAKHKSEVMHLHDLLSRQEEELKKIGIENVLLREDNFKMRDEFNQMVNSLSQQNRCREQMQRMRTGLCEQRKAQVERIDMLFEQFKNRSKRML